MAFYPYSVKELLTAHFGADAVSAMRTPHDAIMGPTDRPHILPLSWQYADECVVDLFLSHRFLIKTELEDDYIAYIYQQGEKQYVFLMFMLDEADAPFSIDLEYACEIIRQWENAGYDAKIVSQCVRVDNYPNSESFRLVQHITPSLGTHTYKLIENNGAPLLVFDAHSCWPAFFEKVVCVSKSQDIREYECLFEPNVAITVGEEKKEKVIASGLDAVVSFLRENTPVKTVFSEFKNTNIYNQHLLAGDKILDIWVNTRNLITKINFSAYDNTRVKECDASNLNESLMARIPTLVSVRALDIVRMHGYVVQLSYSDGSLRNYYLKMLEKPEVPDSITIDGYTFDEKVLNSASITPEGISFDNGFAVAKHLLFHRSYRQVTSSTTEYKACQVGDYTLQSKYRLPLHEFKSHFEVEYYWGNPGECYGPANTMFDKNGKRITDVSFSRVEVEHKDVRRVCVEPTWLFGFLKDDGTWLAPPVYEEAQEFKGVCARVKRKVNGELKQFLIIDTGIEIPFNYRIDTGLFYGGLCPFNAATEEISAPKPGYYWEHEYDDVKAGKWGFVNLAGDIVVEPQYVYAVGFYNGDGKRSVVAKLINGELLWGAVDTTGKEVIPCIYASLYTRCGDAFGFRRMGEELYGVMDFDGNILAEPQFEYFEEYDEKHRLLTVGEHEDAVGVYSIDEQKMIIPTEYDCVDYDEQIISCETAYTCDDRYFDYTGKELDFSRYDRVYESHGLLCVNKDGKHGYIQLDGTEVIPPVLIGHLGGDEIELYRKGYVLTGERKQYGLATVDGQQILPPIFADIYTYDDFVIASRRNDRNWCICDTMYAYDGTPILEGPYRHMYFNGKTGRLTVETPYGTEIFNLRDFEDKE